MSEDALEKCGNLTLDLREASQGDQAAGRRAFEMLYPELEKLARFWIRKKQGKISGLERMSFVAMSAYDELAERIFDKTVRSKSRGTRLRLGKPTAFSQIRVEQHWFCGLEPFK